MDKIVEIMEEHNTKMEDIAILWSSGSPESALWSDYLVASFDKIMSQRARHHYRVTPITAEELMSSDSQEKLEKLSKAQLQIVILCPILASKLSDLKRELHSENLFKLDKVLVMLLGVEKNHVVANNFEDYPSMDQWQMMSVREKDTSFVDTFLTAAVGILRTKDCKDTATDRTSFSIVPKKVKIGQSRVIALLNDPIREEDSIKIMVDKKGEVIHIPTFKKRNPYTLQFDIPESCLEVSMLVWVRVSKNGQSLGRRQIKCESRLRELDQLLRASDHPLEFMCQTLGFKTTSKEQLDSWMLNAFQKNIPPHFNLLSSSEQYNPKSDMTSGEEYPTLLHWAARFGLERVCWQLLECPGGGAAVALRNARRRTPADLARDHRHLRLADMLADHLKINEFSNMYYYLKNMSDNDKEDSQEEDKQGEELCIVETSDTVDSPSNENDKGSEKETMPDPFSEVCTQNLEETPLNREEKKQRPNLKLPKVKEQFYQNDFQLHDNRVDRIQQAIEHDYLVQPSNIKVESPKFRPNNLYANSSRLLPQQTDIFLYSPTEESKAFTIDTPTSDISQINLNIKDIRHSGSIKSGKDVTGQEELAEIITDFKNNVFTISEVEKLVMEWKNRNETQQSLKEKQEQLNKMREEYDKIQLKIKDTMKRPTPFERVKKMFSKSKNKHHDNNTGTIEKRNGNTRPNSSLSDSSSSSGRLSTVSGGSVGETNSVQSELDDKARSVISASTLTMNSCDGENRLDDYLIPPPPRPLNGCPQFTTFGHPKHENRGQHMATIVEREASASRERLDCDSDTSSTHLRLNFGARDKSIASRCDDRDGAHMYMNISASHS
ncbi:phosphoinositide 3-kinase adapter protein 1 isoform X4 [Vanessa atalanta]|uniref:phosphoinositide 3-kinase adapter protein 1 isoform X4 n=1 Tax=Vanessa atalanta TaxID=42275 RepID=UPI001FCD879E|nr:phosphoinositide 3-kinase adapter protein 1 isoform X4 [Vanessa atalanta]